MAAAEHELKPLPLWQTGIALSGAIATFGAWAWLQKADVWTLTTTSVSAGYILLATLSVVLQVASNLAAAAARRARSFGLTRSFQWSVALMTAGAAYNAFSFHNALEVCGMIGPDADASMKLVLTIISIGVAGYEPAIYWIDEALRAETDTRRAAIGAAEDQRVREEAAAREARYDAPVTPAIEAEPPRLRALPGGRAAGVLGVAAAILIANGVSEDRAFAVTAPHEAMADTTPQSVAETLARELLLSGYGPRRAYSALKSREEFQDATTFNTVRALHDRMRRAGLLDGKVPLAASYEDADTTQFSDVPFGEELATA